MVASEAVAAVVVEPVLGEGGFVAPPREFLSGRCRKSAGGTKFCSSPTKCKRDSDAPARCLHLNATELLPDILVIARNRSLRACRSPRSPAARKLWTRPESAGWAARTAGIRCRARRRWRPSKRWSAKIFPREPSNWALDLNARASEWKKRWPLIGDVRGLGAMRALELVRSADQREPAQEETEEVLRHCREHGLILLSAGTYGNVLRVLVPLVITTNNLTRDWTSGSRARDRGRIASGNAPHRA